MTSKTSFAANAAARKREALSIGIALLSIQQNSDPRLQEAGRQLRRAVLCYDWANTTTTLDLEQAEMKNAAEALRLAALYFNRVVGWPNE